MMAQTPSEAVVVIDRFTSASSGQDAAESLQVMVDGLKRFGRKDSAEKGLLWEPAWVLNHDDAPGHLVWLLQHGTLKGSEIPCEEGVNLVCQLYQHLVSNSESLVRPTPGLLLESLLDLIDNSEHPIYVRVLALKVLEELSKRHKSVASTQWLRAPNGLHRLADLLAIDVEINPMEEAIRNQALVVAKLLAREASMAKVFLFAEVECKLLDLCWNEGGLTKGSPIVIDSLELIQELLRHADTPLQDLVWQRPNVAPRLAQLLDLRGGEEFLHPKKAKKSTTATGAGGGDDLETLLASVDARKEQLGASAEREQVHVPRLVQSEEEVVNLVLNILRLILESESLQSIVWTQHFGLCSLVWELALINPSTPPLCALPSPSLQQRALDLVADKFSDHVTMTRHSGLDRLLYLVCTGGGTADQFDEKLGLSQSALAVLRQTLSGEAIHDILIRTLAPPPMEDDDSPPTGPTVVHKLWNTVQENILLTTSEPRTLFLSGALGGLGLMLCDEESREIMFKVAPISMGQLLEAAFNETEDYVQCSLLRFLCEWIYQCPFIARTLLSSNQSMHLAGMGTKASSNQSLVHLLLGVSMESLSKDEECGGWSRSGILQIITKVGISKYTSSLESLKTKANSKMPWVASDMEFKSWQQFCRQAVLGIRKRVVEALAIGDDNDDEDGELEEPLSKSTNVQELRPLQRMISQQAREMDELRRELETSQAKVASQEGQLVKWKRRVESTPTQLDDMLNELTIKTSELEESVQSLKSQLKHVSAAKEADAERFEKALSESKEAIEILVAQKQETQDDFERAEQEMQALSQAYASLEEDYQRNQNVSRLAVGAPTGEASQQEGEGSRQQHATGSTEVATLRAENSRLRNDARAADEWMAMAVQRMNEMGSANQNLEQQVVIMDNEILSLKGQLHEAHVTTQSLSLHHEVAESRIGVLESELGAEKSIRGEAERELSELRYALSSVKNEQEKSAHLEHRLLEADHELSRLRSSHDAMNIDRERLSGIEGRIADAEVELKVTTENLLLEKKANHELENQLGALKLEIEQLQWSLEQSMILTTDSKGSTQLNQVQGDSGIAIASTDSEFRVQPGANKSCEEVDTNEAEGGPSLYTTTASELEEVRQKSEQEIYRLESVIRELENRLGSGLGGYKIEDIRTRDAEIDELRKANEAAQEWMTKAVEHHHVLSAQISKLSKEKSSLTVQLDNLQARLPQGDIDQESAENAREQLLEKIEELMAARRELTILKSEFDELNRKKDENQGFLDELGIALEDVGILQQKLLESQSTVRDLEAKLAGNILNAENVELASTNKDLEQQVVEFQTWVEMAQTKISELMSSNDDCRRLHQELKQKLENQQNETKAIAVRLDDTLKANDALVENTNTLARLKIDLAKLEEVNNSLQTKNNRMSEELTEKISEYNSLQDSADLSQSQLGKVTAAYEILEVKWKEEKELLRVQCVQNVELKDQNTQLLTRLEDLQAQGSSAQIVEITDKALSINDGANEEMETMISEIMEELRLKENALAEVCKSLSEYEDILKDREGNFMYDLCVTNMR
jgi:chromosome segregation ATPase